MKTKEELVKLLQVELFGVNFITTLKGVQWVLQNDGKHINGNYYTEESIKKAFVEIANKQIKFSKVVDADNQTTQDAIEQVYQEQKELLSQVFYKE